MYLFWDYTSQGIERHNYAHTCTYMYNKLTFIEGVTDIRGERLKVVLAFEGRLIDFFGVFNTASDGVTDS